MKRARQTAKKTKRAGAKRPVRQTNKKKRTKLGCLLKTLGWGFVGVAVLVVFLLGIGFISDGDAFIPVDEASGKINVLLLGVDAEGLRTDAIMVASYNFDTGHVNLLSVPRDTKVYVQNRSVYRKINEVHAMHDKDGEILGPRGTAEVIGQVTGIPINYYLEFSFTAIDNFMNILGPVKYDVPDIEGNGKGMNYDDPVQNLHIHLKPGQQELSGNQVQQFLRYRKSNDGSTDGSDLSRIQRQQDFVKAVIDQKVNVTLLMKLPEIFRQMNKELNTNLSFGDVAKYVRYLTGLKSEDVTTFQLPGEDKYIGGGWYFVLDEEAAKTLIRQEFGYDAREITTDVTVSAFGQSGKTTPKPKTTQKPKTTSKPKTTEEPTKATKKPTASPAKETKSPATDKPKKTDPPAEPTRKSEPTDAPVAEHTEDPDDEIVSLD